MILLTAEDFEKFHLILSKMRWDATNADWPDAVSEIVGQLQAETASFQRLSTPESGIGDPNWPYAVENSGSAPPECFVVTGFLRYFQYIALLLCEKRYGELFEIADGIHEFPKIWLEDEKKAVRLMEKFNRSISKKATNDRKNRESPKI